MWALSLSAELICSPNAVSWSAGGAGTHSASSPRQANFPRVDIVLTLRQINKTAMKAPQAPQVSDGIKKLVRIVYDNMRYSFMIEGVPSHCIVQCSTI